MEITEHTAVEDYEALSAALRPHRDAGLRLAVDDAGAGYASLLHILKLRPDFIKIDLSLVRDIHLDPARQALVTLLVSFARKVDAVLVAEGVEQQAELDMLVTLGVRQMQGYLLCAPCTNPPTTGFQPPLSPCRAHPRRHPGLTCGDVPLSGGRDPPRAAPPRERGRRLHRRPAAPGRRRHGGRGLR